MSNMFVSGDSLYSLLEETPRKYKDIDILDAARNMVVSISKTLSRYDGGCALFIISIMNEDSSDMSWVLVDNCSDMSHALELQHHYDDKYSCVIIYDQESDHYYINKRSYFLNIK